MLCLTHYFLIRLIKTCPDQTKDIIMCVYTHISFLEMKYELLNQNETFSCQKCGVRYVIQEFYNCILNLRMHYTHTHTHTYINICIVLGDEI